MTIKLNQDHIVLKPTRVGNAFLRLAHIRVTLVARVKKYNCQICMPNINPGIMMIALANQDTNSMVL